MKRTFKILIVILGILTIFNIQVSASQIVGLTNFKKITTYQDTFLDVNKGEWYYENIKSVYEYGVMNGVNDTQFSTIKNISIAETITIAVRINSGYYVGYMESFPANNEGKWYNDYIYAAQEASIINSYPNYESPATRAQFAQILANSINKLEFEEINYIADGSIPDIDTNAGYAEDVYMLYRAGVLSGSDEKGSFKPDSTITRAEAAAIITRIIDPTLRKSIELYGEF